MSSERAPVQRRPRTSGCQSQRPYVSPASRSAHQICNDNVLRSEPRDNTKVTQSRHQQTGQKIPDESSEPDTKKEIPARDHPASRRFVFRIVHRGKHCSRHQSTWPNHRRRSNEIAACKTSEGVAQNLC